MAKGTIIIIEDDRGIRSLLKKMLSALDYMVLDYPTGEKGSIALMTQRPKLIICDIMMPGISGIEVCKRTRQQTLGIPFIFLTANNDSNTLKQALAVGANDYVVKQQHPAKILERVKYWLGPAGRLDNHELISRALDRIEEEEQEAELARAEDITLSSDNNDAVRIMSRHIAVARRAAGDEFGKTVEQKLYLLGYVTGMVTDRAARSSDLSDRFMEYLEAVLSESGILGPDEVSHMVQSLPELESARVFKAAREYGMEDSEDLRDDPDHEPDGLADYKEIIDEFEG